ncbi:putative regulator of Ty1 transposition protein 107 BRCT domain containing protein [Lyophyllum shimeji]|uniref:Regulator of Ty1 transposition protein 107 BRCT domain containing protein n=1 Tax=Lyophyllum shimeji TaxID=47721 RepID=A0A9P3PKF3_LYOSH|nr:putative regulator of Ty1 transposition protein 107 BRCT domain containing protein [Lyophyllum shimeji]
MHLFDGVYYCLSPSLSEKRVNELSHVLDSNGAVRVDSIDDSTLTHFITSTNRFERWQEVVAREEAGTLAVVTDKWVDRSMLLGKLQPPSCYSADPAMIFSGVVGCAAELPATDLEVLSAGITALGGQWRTGLTKDVTHLFCISQTSPKYATALHFQEHTQVKVLLPHWFDDAVRLGMGNLDTTPYEWPNPPLLNLPGGGDDDKDTAKEREDALKKAALRKLDSEKKSLYRTAELLMPGAPLPTGHESTSQSSGAASPSKAKNVWQGRRVLLGHSLELVGRRRDAVEAEIQRSGGEVVPCGEHRDEEAAAVDLCDVFVTRYRSGKAYVQAVRQSKTIGTLPWLFHVQSTGVLSPPMDQLLWYPIPRRPIDGFSAHEITVTNYTGESREYIKKLIAAMGATFTPSMSGKNTVLIAAYISGTKTTKAASWSIPIVNHTWLEDCFVKWRNLTVALEKYIVFPPGVDFSTMLGSRGVGRAVEDIGEEELEMLEQEGEEEEEEARGESEKKRSGALSATQNSARDAREVEEAIGAGLFAYGDAQMAVEVEQPEVHANVGEEPHGGMEMAVDEERNDAMEEQPPTVSKSTPPPSSMKSMAERLKEEKGESAAKTRVKRRPKGKPQPTPLEERSPMPEVRVMKRKSGQIEVTPVKKRARVVENGAASSSSDEVEVVEPVKKGKRVLVRRAGEGTDVSMLDAVLITPLKHGNKAAKGGSDGEEEAEEEEPVKKVTKQLKKTALKKLPSKGVFSDDDCDEAEIEEVVVVDKSKLSAKMKITTHGEAGEDEEISVKEGKRKLLGGKPRSDEAKDDAEVIKGKRRKAAQTSPPTTKTRTKGISRRQPGSDGESGPEVEADEDVAIDASASKTKGKAKATELENVERPKPRPVGNGKRVVAPLGSVNGKGKRAVDTSESEEEEEHVRPPPKPQPPSSKSKKASTPPASDAEEDEDDAIPPPAPGAKKSTAQPARVRKGGKFKLAVSEEEEDEKDVSPPPRPTKKSSNTRRESTTVEPTPSAASPSKTPKRVVSVLLPHLTLSTKQSPPKATEHTRLTRMESIHAAAGERASTSRTTAAPSRSTSKSKSMPKPAPPVPAASSSPAPVTAGDEDTLLVINGRAKRSAATKATQKLHDEIMPDVMNYQQEMRNAGKGGRSLGGSVSGASAPAGGSGTGKRRQSVKGGEEQEEDEEEVRDMKRRRLSAPNTNKKQKAPEEESADEEPAKPVKSKGKGKKPADVDEDEVEVVSPVKKAERKAKKDTKGDDLNSRVSAEKTVRLMTTQVTLSEDVIKALTKLGVKLTTRSAECTHLLAPHLVRTEKFLCALANSSFILTEKWATDSAAARKLLDEGDYLLHDKANERRLDVVLADALARAKKLQGTLFAKTVFYVTPKVSIDIKLLKNVVTACGGQVSTQQPTLRILNANPGRYIISCPEDVSIWRPIAHTHPVYTHELILTSALKQEVDWENESYRVPGSRQS